MKIRVGALLLAFGASPAMAQTCVRDIDCAGALMCDERRCVELPGAGKLEGAAPPQRVTAPAAAATAEPAADRRKQLGAAFEEAAPKPAGDERRKRLQSLFEEPRK